MCVVVHVAVSSVSAANIGRSHFFAARNFQKNMTSILIVGAGAQGAPCAAVLARHAGVGRIFLGSSKLAAAASVRDRIGSPKVEATELDARALHRALGQARPGAEYGCDLKVAGA